ncbi:amidohydrolase family protein [Hymenobacter sp. GOD-10R]|uniref:amidohydrolase family protein n=1 Tax=Hymenobacter sp. GOD-10R TaxID=3093922 RepID=UPI002D78C198|nr:amidohydrolase family protein [Hymenobacter sp. GOD-10R]WRQ31177.1 amidohydrolase family protein [Hymenobacter sp. GOD-10R]
MPHYRSILAGALVLLGASFHAHTPGQAQAAPYDLVISHANLVDVVSGSVRPDQVVAIRGDVIRVVEKASAKKYVAKRYLDAKGKFLMPGLWDMHVHFRGGDSLVQANQNLLPLYLAHGITTVRDAGGDMTPSVFRWRRQMQAGTLAGPRIFTSGPKIDGPQAYWPGSLEVETPAQIAKALDSLQSIKVDYVKIYDSKISGEAYLNVIAAAEKRGMKTTGHMPYSVKLGDAVERGLDATEHLYYVFKACSGKEDSLTTLVKKSLTTSKPLGLFAMLPAVEATYDPAAANRIFKLMVAHKTAAVPTLFIGKTLADLPDTDHSRDTMLAYIDPKIQATYTRRLSSAKGQSAEANQFRKKLETRFMSLVPKMQAAGVVVLAGSDSGAFNSFTYPGASLVGEVEMLVQAGLTPAQALRAATINGARFMGVEGTAGTIGVGKNADLVLLERNPLTDIHHIRTINTVVSRGKPYSRQDLAAMLQAIKHK